MKEKVKKKKKTMKIKLLPLKIPAPPLAVPGAPPLETPSDKSWDQNLRWFSGPSDQNDLY